MTPLQPVGILALVLIFAVMGVMVYEAEHDRDGGDGCAEVREG